MLYSYKFRAQQEREPTASALRERLQRTTVLIKHQSNCVPEWPNLLPIRRKALYWRVTPSRMAKPINARPTELISCVHKGFYSWC